MDWSRWLIGTTEREELCRFCQTIIKVGDAVVLEEGWPSPECIHCHLERLRALTKKAKPKNKPKPKGAVMPWKQVGSGGGKIEKWTEGMVVEGKVIKRHSNDVGALMDFRDEKLGEITLSVPAQLDQQLSMVAPDARLRIECGNKVPLGGGKSAWRFRTFEDV